MAGTRLPPIMDKDQENPNPQSNSQVPSEDSSTEANESPHEEDPLALEPAADSDKEDLINEDSDLEKKESGKKGWLLFLILFITLGTGFYFYTQKKVGDFFTNLPEDSKKSFLTMPQIPSPPDTQSKEMPVDPTVEIVEQAARADSPEKILFENEKTIDLLRDEIQSLKSELKRKNSSPLPQNFRGERQHISGEVLKEETEAVTQKKEDAPAPELETSLLSSSPVKIAPPIQQNQIQKNSPKRSKEVQAYLDFIENIGSKFIGLVKEGWARFQASIL